jgi:hypothetical protein
MGRNLPSIDPLIHLEEAILVFFAFNIPGPHCYHAMVLGVMRDNLIVIQSIPFCFQLVTADGLQDNTSTIVGMKRPAQPGTPKDKDLLQFDFPISISQVNIW